MLVAARYKTSKNITGKPSEVLKVEGEIFSEVEVSRSQPNKMRRNLHSTERDSKVWSDVEVCIGKA